jgi:excisionase family DNA binding protein
MENKDDLLSTLKTMLKSSQPFLYSTNVKELIKQLEETNPDDLKEIEFRLSKMNFIVKTVRDEVKKVIQEKKVEKNSTVKDDIFYTVEDLCKMLKLSDPTIRNYIKELKLKSINITGESKDRGNIRVSKTDLDDFIRKNSSQNK